MALEELLTNRAFLIGVVAVSGAYLLYMILKLMRPEKSTYEKEIEKILTSDEHKVKGRFS